ncbi:MAG: Stp1/IreP family PP2C-type Ser/Thr phosphatase [Planctomycetota bacterium]
MQKKVEIVCKTDVGMVRTENQDHFGMSVPKSDEALRERGSLIVVADGMGGHTGGTIASHTAVDSFLEAFGKSTERSLRAVLDESIRASNAAVRDKADHDPKLKDMGTTCVAALVRGSSIMVGHLGDSRCYLIRGDQMEQVTRDHTYLNELIDMGLLTPEQAEGHPDKNIITRCVGMAQSLEIEFNQRKAEKNDRVVLCSDGLTNMVRDEEIRTLASLADPSEACDKLIALANERGGDDNITIAIVVVNEVPEGDPELEALDLEDAELMEQAPADTVRTKAKADSSPATVISPDAKTPTSFEPPNEAKLDATEENLKAEPDVDLDETVRIDESIPKPGKPDEDPPTHPAWFWLIGVEIVILVLLQMWISRL